MVTRQNTYFCYSKILNGIFKSKQIENDYSFQGDLVKHFSS